MWSSIRFALVLLAAYLMFLLIHLPAAQILPRLPLPEGVKVGVVSGSVWDGHLSRAVVQGIPIEDIDWQLSPWALFIGELAVTVDAGHQRQSDSVAVNGNLTLSAGTIRSRGLEVYLPTSQVIARLPLPIPVKAGGRFKVSIEQLMASNKGCQQLKGQGQWLNASVAGTQGPIELGQFDADLACADGALAIEVSEPNSFGLSATATVPADLDIRVSGRFRPESSLPKEVHDAARFFGQPDAQGYYQVRF